jgi:hypothetical protein
MKCRAGKCGMNLAHKGLRDQHEGMFHKNMWDEALARIISKIHSTTPKEALDRKVFVTSLRKLSYNEITMLHRESKEYSEVKNVFVNIMQKWLDENPDKTIEDFLKVNKFRVSGT